jgi:hypothetical protein
MVQTRQALIWKLRPAEMRLSERDSIQEKISAKFRKSIAQLSVWTSYDYRLDGA